MKDPGDNRAILSSARNRVTAQRMWIKRMSVVRSKISKTSRYPLYTCILFSHLTRNYQPPSKFSFFKSMVSIFLIARTFGVRNGRNVLWSLKGWTVLEYNVAGKDGREVFRFAVPSTDPKRDFKERWKFYWDSTREKKELLARLQILRSTKFLLLPPEKAKRLVSQCSGFFFSIRSFPGRDEGGVWICKWMKINSEKFNSGCILSNVIFTQRRRRYKTKVVKQIQRNRREESVRERRGNEEK